MSEAYNNSLIYLDSEEDSGVVVGKTADGRVLASNGPEPVLVMGPARCGKGINTVIPTALTWKGSAFFLDYKGEAWHLTSSYREKALKQETIKFEPSAIDEADWDKAIESSIDAFLDPNKKVSLYLVIPVQHALAMQPVVRQFMDTLMVKITECMDSAKQIREEQRLLMMLDEFPMIGNLLRMELFSATCASYGVKMCIVCRDVNQIYEAYTKDNSILANCHVQLHFAPDSESGGDSAKYLADTLGKASDEFMFMGYDEACLFAAGEIPVKVQKLRYYDEPRFASKIDKRAGQDE